MIDHSLQHHTRLTGANRGMDEMLDSGGNILASLKEQRMSLKVFLHLDLKIKTREAENES